MRARWALIVEYNPWLRLRLSSLLKESGFEVQLASNGGRTTACRQSEARVGHRGGQTSGLSAEQLVAELEAWRSVWGTRVLRVRDLLSPEALPLGRPHQFGSPSERPGEVAQVGVSAA